MKKPTDFKDPPSTLLAKQRTGSGTEPRGFIDKTAKLNRAWRRRAKHFADLDAPPAPRKRP